MKKLALLILGTALMAQSPSLPVHVYLGHMDCAARLLPTTIAQVQMYCYLDSNLYMNMTLSLNAGDITTDVYSKVDSTILHWTFSPDLSWGYSVEKPSTGFPPAVPTVKGQFQLQPR